MNQNKSAGFDKVQEMVRNHLRDAAKGFTGRAGDNPGPTPDQSYSVAYATASGAYAGRGINVDEWVSLQGEIRSHQAEGI